MGRARHLGPVHMPWAACSGSIFFSLFFAKSRTLGLWPPEGGVESSGLAVGEGDLSHTDTPTQCLPTGFSPTMILGASTDPQPLSNPLPLSLTPVCPHATWEGH